MTMYSQGGGDGGGGQRVLKWLRKSLRAECGMDRAQHSARKMSLTLFGTSQVSCVQQKQRGKV